MKFFCAGSADARIGFPCGSSSCVRAYRWAVGFCAASPAGTPAAATPEAQTRRKSRRSKLPDSSMLFGRLKDAMEHVVGRRFRHGESPQEQGLAELVQLRRLLDGEECLAQPAYRAGIERSGCYEGRHGRGFGHRDDTHVGGE